MKEFELVGADVFVTRAGISPFLASFGVYQSRGEKVVKRHLGITELSDDPDTRLSLRGYLAALQELQTQFGASFIRKMGSLILTSAVFPPGLDTLEKVLSTMTEAYYMNHSTSGGRTIGGYNWTSTGERRGSMRCDNPYPCALDLGLLESALTRFGMTGTVAHDESQPCRHKGGDSCTYLVEW
jgi:hypothetical protein